MQLTKEQYEAIQAIRDMQVKHPGGGQIVLIGGYAGVGKSQTLKTLCEEEDDDGNSVCLLAPTGKAALRITEITGTEASTIHKWLYIPNVDEETGIVTFELRTPATIDGIPTCGYVVCDEASMLSLELFSDLYRIVSQLGLNLVLIGDPFQLPPINSDFSVFGGLPTFRSIFMTNVHRQAKDSPIIVASMALRESNWSSAIQNLQVLGRDEFNSMAIEAAKDQDSIVIVHRNVTRNQMNTAIRNELFGPGKVIAEGERLVVNKNNYPLDVFNGQIVTVTDVRLVTTVPHKVMDKKRGITEKTQYYEITFNGKKAIVASIYLKGDNKINEYWHEMAGNKFIRDRYKGDTVKPTFLHANYGYALTAHKSQGSGWKKVFVNVEPTVVNDFRWSYSAVTRAKESVYVCFR